MTTTAPEAPPGGASPIDRASCAVVPAVLAGGHHVVHGAPGSGKSRLAVEIMAALAGEGGTEDLLLLAPTRRAADRLRDALAERLPVTVGRVLVRTPASFAFSVLRARAALLGEPPPVLLTGADQDATLTQLLLGHAEGEGRDPGWPEDVPTEALTLATFRHELRDVLMRAAEAGWDGVALQAMGERYGRPAWTACGRVLQEYEEVTRLGETTPDRGTRYDVATILDEAVLALAGWEAELPGHPRPRLRAVVHDDYQDATLAVARLLRVLSEDGSRLVLLGDPDAAVQTFRGAMPGLLERAASGSGMLAGIQWPSAGPASGRAGSSRSASSGRTSGPASAQVGEFGAMQHVLHVVWRGDERLRRVVTDVAAGLPALGDVQRRRTSPVHREGGSSVRAMVARSTPEEARLIARVLREHHLRDGVAWADMVVLARSTGQLPVLRRGLRAGGVPVATAQGELPLAAEPAVRPLLCALEVATSEPSSLEHQDEPVPPALTAAAVIELLLSPVGGMDHVGLRAVRRRLRGLEAAAGGTRDSDALLVEAVTLPAGHLDQLGVGPRLRGSLARVARVLRAGQEAQSAGADLEHVLWALWEATGLAGPWRERALGVGAAAERADADLDAVIALFRAAESFVARQEGARAGDFVTYLQTQEFATDTLASTGTRRAVEVTTAAAAAGREWDVVVVAGLQEDVWPDLRLRARLLDPVGIADVAAGRGTEPPRPVDARRAVLADEQRLLVSAVSRARQHLLATAVQDADTRPSHFMDVIDPLPPEQDGVRPITPVPPALDLRGLVGTLRREVLRDGERAAVAADLLAVLAAAEVPGAAPSAWWGHDVSTDQPLWAPGGRVPVSPSKLTTLGQCELRWALQTAGGEAGRSPSAELGTLVHGIAADAPRGEVEELLALLAERWGTLGLGEGWGAVVQRRRAENMVRLLAEYQSGIPGRVETEVSFEVAIDRADLAGRVDRVEYLDDGRVRIVDLKTSASPVTKDAAAEHPQLAAYQAAAAVGGFGEVAPGGSRLVYLGTKSIGSALREQAAPEDDWPLRLVSDAAETMASAAFTARSGAHCRVCPVSTSCPVRPEGGRVVGR